MPNLLTAVWGVQFKDFCDESLGQKAMRFGNAVGAANGVMQSLKNSMDMPTACMLFVAPEYYFVHDRDFGLLTLEEKNEMEEAIRAVSNALQGLVIVPGTINYKIELDMLADTVARGRGTRRYGANSFCPIYCSGTRLLDYYKRSNDNIYDKDCPQQDAYFLAGTKAGNFHHNNIHFGVDICKDFGDGQLAGDVGSGALDVHIVASGTHINVFADSNRLAARDGGYFVHVDSDDDPRTDRQKNGVWVVHRGAGLHGNEGRSLSGTASPAALADPRLAKYSSEQKINMKVNAHLRRTGAEVIKNVTKQSPVAKSIPNYPEMKVYTCPL